jgi:predicted DNA-binding WGR domain protein
VVGWPGRLRHTRKELENRIKAQRANTFGRKWFEEFLDAQEAALAKAGKAKSEKQREALVEAVAATQQVDTEAEATALSALLAAAVNASRVTASIKRADEVVRLAARRELDDEDDDEEAMMLLLH